MPWYLPVPPVMMCVPQLISDCDLSTSRVSKVEKILSPSASARTHAPSMYFLSPDWTFSARHLAAILSSIFSPFMLSVVPVASSAVTVPTPGTSMLIKGRKTKCVTEGDVPLEGSSSAANATEVKSMRAGQPALIKHFRHTGHSLSLPVGPPLSLPQNRSASTSPHIAIRMRQANHSYPVRAVAESPFYRCVLRPSG